MAKNDVVASRKITFLSSGEEVTKEVKFIRCDPRCPVIAGSGAADGAIYLYDPTLSEQPTLNQARPIIEAEDYGFNSTCLMDSYRGSDGDSGKICGYCFVKGMRR